MEPQARADAGDTLREQLAELVAGASDDEVTAAEILAAPGASLPELGLTSLTQLRLIDEVEERYGVEVDLGGDVSFLDTLDGLVEYVTAHGAGPPR